MNSDIKKILVIGSGPSDIGHESEQNGAAYEAMMTWKELGIETFILENNPYSIMIQELPQTNVFIDSISSESVERIILEEKIDAVTPIFGKKDALKIIQRLNRNDFFQQNNVKIIGLSSKNISLFGGTTSDNAITKNTFLARRLVDNSVPILETNVVNNFDELRATIDKIKFPISAKPINAGKSNRRYIFKNIEQLNADIDDLFRYSDSGKVGLEREVGGYKEIGMVAIRDTNSNKMIISSLEDMNPVGINSIDSVVFAPAQTLNETQIHLARSLTFRILDCLGIKGICHVQFALNPKTNECYVIKVNPYFNGQTAISEKSNGYPLARVVAAIMVDQTLTDIKLPNNYHENTAVLQPISDHVTVKMPVWSFDYLPKTNRKLGPHAKSTGSSIGFGRNVEAAFMNALRSSQTSPKDVLPSFGYLNEDELISQLIHPTDIQILILFEAVKRGYLASDLAELTKIDEFFFLIMQNILDSISFIEKNSFDKDAFLLGSRNGFGIGMFCHFWNTENIVVRDLQKNHSIKKTYKMIEPTAREFKENINSFFSSFESESESEQLSEESALIIGKGRNHLGPNTASELYSAEMLIRLKKLGIKTIILNNNPNSVSLIQSISDKQYVEPVQLGEILDIIELEKPKYIFLPGNRHYLIRELEKLKNTKLIILPPDQKTALWNTNTVDFAMNFLVTKDDIIPIAVVGFSAQENNPDRDLNLQTDYFVPYKLSKSEFSLVKSLSIETIRSNNLTGLIQVCFNFDKNKTISVSGLSPLRITETVFLNTITGINWIEVLMRMYTGKFDANQIKNELKSNLMCSRASIQVEFPFKELEIKNGTKSRNFEVGARLKLKK
ncbi:carbamoyl-phosphate synthase [Fructilactobacillus vespulae]|uniref:carbamoyl phosphate synthase preATP-grasp domain-containing protein n=1 Tax=Fructilactobacillus vespulae TaxID=1249630 RepID=UPI0039B3BF5A